MTVNTYSTKNKKLSNFSVTDKEYQERLARAEAALGEWIDFRNAWAENGNGKRKLSLQKKQEAIGC